MSDATSIYSLYLTFLYSLSEKKKTDLSRFHVDGVQDREAER